MLKAKKILQKVEALEAVLNHRVLQAKKDNTAVVILKEHIKRLEKQNQELMDRLMARDIPELKTYTIPVSETVYDPYRAEEDEDIAGEIIEGDENG